MTHAAYLDQLRRALEIVRSLRVSERPVFARIAGTSAFFNGSANPYPEGSAEWAEWIVAFDREKESAS